MKNNPDKALDAILSPARLTLAHIALFEKINAPILYADISNLSDNLIAVWIYKTPLAEVVKNFENRELLALEMSEKMSGEEYGTALAELCKACTDFYDMLPRPESGGEVDANGEMQPKKAERDSATDGLPSSRNSFAEHIITMFRKCFKKCRAFISRFSTDAGRKQSEN